MSFFMFVLKMTNYDSAKPDNFKAVGTDIFKGK
jgi:hypothetical protein